MITLAGMRRFLRNMRCPNLNELPPPPPGKIGWPWTEESPQLPDVMPDGSPWPRISIVTPSYNQGQFIEETVRSVLLQGYPNLEYIIIDGGSTDESVEIIRKYEPWLAYWVSEEDRGQSHGINKGFERTTGTLTAWLNSDDLYLPCAFECFTRGWRSAPDAVAWVGTCHLITPEMQVMTTTPARNLTAQCQIASWGQDGHFMQPACLISTSAWKSVGALDETLHYAFDVDLWMRLVERGQFVILGDIVAAAIVHPQAKTQAFKGKTHAEIIALQIAYGYRDIALAWMERMMTPPLSCRQACIKAVLYRINQFGRLFRARQNQPLLSELL